MDDSVYPRYCRYIDWIAGSDVPLTVGAAPFIARMVENALRRSQPG